MLKFLPTSLVYQSIVSATREVVAGVQYNIYVEAMNNTDIIICELDILEKPWIVNEWGEKKRTLLYSNCSNYDEEFLFETTTENETGNKINPIFVNKKNIEMTDERLKELEALILPVKPKKRPIVLQTIQNIASIISQNENVVSNKNSNEVKELVETTTISDEDEKATIVLSDSAKQQLDDFFNFGGSSSYLVDDKPKKQIEEAIIIPIIKNYTSIDEADILKSTTERIIDQTTVIYDQSNSSDNPIEDNIEKIKPTTPEIVLVQPNFDEPSADHEVTTHAISSTGHTISNDVKSVDQLEISSRKRRHTKEINTEKEYFEDLAKQALKMLDHFDVDKFKRVLLELIDVKELQTKKDGRSIILRLLVGNSGCDESHEDENDCESLLIKNSIKYCVMEVIIFSGF